MLNHITTIAGERRKRDIKLFENFLDTLPAGGSIQSIKEISGKTWHTDSVFSHLSTARHEWDNVEHVFLDKKIESKKQKFFNAAADYIAYFSMNTFTQAGNIEWSELPVEWEENNRERLEEVSSTISTKGRKVGEMYEDFVTFTQKRLYTNRVKDWVVAIILILLPGSLLTLLAQWLLDIIKS